MPAKQTTSPGRSRRRWRVVLVVAFSLLVGGGLALGLAITRRPAWYQPMSIDHARLRADKAALFALQEKISAALNAGREVEFALHEDQVNRWLAARTELEPLAGVVSLPLTDPVVSFSPTGIRVASRVRRHGVEFVLSVRGRVEPADDRVTVTCDALQAGALPLPRAWLWSASSAKERVESSVSGPASLNVLTLPNDWLWPNGKQRFQLRRFELAEGRVHIQLRPLPR